MREVWRQGALLPPRPLLRDWPVAGASAGLLLGGAALLVAAAQGAALPPPLLLGLLLAASALPCAFFAGCLGAGFRTLGIRPTRSTLVGLMLAPQGWTLACRAPVEALGAGETLVRGDWLALAGACAAAAVAAVLTAQLGHRAERAGLPLSPVLTWGCAGLLLSCLEWLASGPALPALSPEAIRIGVVAVAAALSALAYELGRRRSSRPRRSFLRLACGLLGLAAGSALAPLAWPWLLYDNALPRLDDAAPPNVLAVALAPGAPAGALPPSVELLRWQGISYGALSAGAGLAEALTLPGGEPLASRLVGAGFATAAIQGGGARPRGFPEVDARRAPLPELEARAPWLHGLPLLRGPGAPLLARVGLDARNRRPAEIAAAASRWLLHWRTRRAPNPFFLLVDLRTPAPASGEALDRALARLLRDLDQLEVADQTLVLVSLESAAQRPARLVLRPPDAWSLPGGGRRVARVDAGRVAQALFDWSRGARPSLPGLPARRPEPTGVAGYAPPSVPVSGGNGGSGGFAHSMISAIR